MTSSSGEQAARCLELSSVSSTLQHDREQLSSTTNGDDDDHTTSNFETSGCCGGGDDDDVMKLCKSNGCMILLFGQGLSFLLASGGAAQATLHLQCNLSAPTFTSSIIYFILSFNLIPLYFKGRKLRRLRLLLSDGPNTNSSNDQRDGIIVSTAHGPSSSSVPHEPYYWWCGILPLVASPWAYLAISFLDVQANYMTVLAYRYTTITSITLFDALAIPSAMTLSRIFLRRRYGATHYCGVVLCMCGVIANVWADYETDSSSSSSSSTDVTEEYPHKVFGDVLAICGGIVYGANDMLAETAVRRFGGPTEFLGMLGMFGLGLSVVQATILERNDVVQFFAGGNACSVAASLGLLVAYALTNALSYVGASRFLLISEAAFLNLSFLTGDFWTLAFSIVAERTVPSRLFFVALLLTISGVVVYEMGPSAIVGDDTMKYRTVVHGETELMESSGDTPQAG